MARALWWRAQEVADNPTIWKRVKHSKHLDKYRRTAVLFKKKKFKAATGKVLAMGGGIGASVALNLIPIPYVKDLVTAIAEKGYGKLKSHSHEQAAKHATSASEKAKFLLKELSVENLDRYRWKIVDAERTFQKLWTYALHSESSTRSICNDYGKAMAKYFYMEKRIQKMEADLAGMKEAIQVTEQWLNQIKGLNAGRTKKFIELSSAIVKVDSEKHDGCDPTLCVHDTKVRLSTKFGSHLGKLSKGFGWLVDVGAPDYTSPDTYATDDQDVKAKKATGKNTYFEKV